ncbi:MAG: 5-carboxymethyl-2-hydroxymuconate Delta-isomerase [Gammaproteobacteria bacterium]|nr:5-carboxymethyl-2-hydroxymuconate Delta-isomerase [Gammaproteobacteria bacterium]
MPHVMIDCSADILNDNALASLVKNVHQAVANTGLFNVENIKTRCVPARHYRVGNGNKSYIHVEIRIRPGRDIADKNVLSASVLNIIKKDRLSDVVTVEIIDMDSSCYSKYSS